MIAVALAVGCLPGNLQRKLGVQSEVKAEESISDPRIVSDDSMEYSKQKVTWDCVWFGSYPQTEIVATDDYNSVAYHIRVAGDYEVNANTFDEL